MQQAFSPPGFVDEHWALAILLLSRVLSFGDTGRVLSVPDFPRRLSQLCQRVTIPVPKNLAGVSLGTIWEGSLKNSFTGKAETNKVKKIAHLTSNLFYLSLQNGFMLQYLDLQNISEAEADKNPLKRHMLLVDASSIAFSV